MSLPQTSNPKDRVTSLKYKLFSATALNLADHAVRIASAFLVSPLLINGLGREAYGLWILALSYVFYLELFDLGLSNTTVRFFSTSLGAPDEDLLGPLFHEIRAHYRKVSLSVIILSLVGGGIIAHLSHANAVKSALLFTVLGLALGVTFQVRVYAALLKANLKYTVITAVSCLKVLAFTVTLIVFRHWQLSIYALLSIHVTLQLLEQFSWYIFARPLVPPRTGVRLSRAVRKDVIAYASKFTFSNAAAFLRDRMDTQLLAAFVSLASVTQYSVGCRIPLLFMDLQNSLFGGHLVAAFGMNSSRKLPCELKEDLLSVLRLSAAGAVIGGSTIFLLGPNFINRWLGPGFEEANAVLRILIPGISLTAMQYPSYTLMAAINRLGRLVLMTFGGAMMNFVLSYILVQRIGVTGVVWGTTIELSLNALLILPFLVAPALKMSSLGYIWQGILLPIFKLGFTFLPVAWLIFHSFNPTTYGGLFVASTVIGLVGAIAAWTMIFKRSERSFITDQSFKLLWKLTRRPKRVNVVV